MSRPMTAIEKWMAAGTLGLAVSFLGYGAATHGGAAKHRRDRADDPLAEFAKNEEKPRGYLDIDDERAVTKTRVQKLVYEAYPQWSLANPRVTCPGSIYDLVDYLNVSDHATSDAWFNPLHVYCGDAAPPEAHGFGIGSPGPDGLLDTLDDVNSWDP